MGWPGANLSIEKSQAAYNRVSDIATSLQGPHETRTFTQLCADVFADLLIDGVTTEGLGAGIRAEVLITVPVPGLLGHSSVGPQFCWTQ